MAKATSLVRVTADTNDYERNIKKAQKAFNDFTRSMGVDVKKFSAMGLAIGAVTTAVKVAGDAFKANERLIDEWGRTTAAAQSVYEGFLTALNSGNISGYLKNINSIIKAARDAYDALDYLQTMKNINSPGTAQRQTEITRLQTMLRTGRAIDSLTGGQSFGTNGELLTATQKQQVADALKKLLEDERNIISGEVKAATIAIDALYDKQARNLGMSRADFLAGTANMDEFSRRLEGAAKYRDYEKYLEKKALLNYNTGSTRPDTTNPYAEFEAWGIFKDDGKLYQQILQEIQKRSSAESRYYGMVAQSYRGINRVEGGGSGGGAKGGGGSNKEFVMPLLQMAGIGEGMTGSIADALTIPDSVIEANKNFFEENYIRMKNLEDEAARMSATWDLVAGSISTVGGALAGLEDPTARIAGTLMQAVATLALSYAEAVAQAAKLGPVAWMAFGATGLATLLSTTSTIKGITKGGFAEGGIIPGNYYNDQLSTANYGLSSGELILNKAQQGNLASQLSGGLGRMQLTAVVTGEQLRLVLNSNGRRTGRGEYVTTNFR